MDNEQLIQKLLEKSKEAFILSIENYNKPTIKYRVESFAFFICNAWELMLKAHLLNLGENIYYKDKPDRTISLSECLKKVFTNDKDPLRLNLMKIIELRDTSTHFVTEEYEMLYIPLFQACVFNFIEKINKFHNFDMTTLIPQNFLTLSVSINPITETEIRAKYSKQIADKLLNLSDSLIPLIESNNSHFAIKVEHYYYITKDKDKATETLAIDSQASDKVKIIKELKDPSVTHKYTMKMLNDEINKQLSKAGINISFNQYTFQLFCKYYGLKDNDRFCYTHKIGNTINRTYSQQAIELIVQEIKKDPDNIISNLKEKIKKGS